MIVSAALFLFLYVLYWFVPGEARAWLLLSCAFIAVRSLILALAAPYMPDKENESD